MYPFKSESKRLHPARYVVVGFATVILLGGLLLNLPMAVQPGKNVSFLDALFTATSAVCVTGLVVTDTATTWSTFGHVVIIGLIQIGGLGFMSIATLVPLILKRKINLRDRIILKESFNQIDLQGIVKLLKKAIYITFTIELLGAISLSTVFVPKFGLLKGVGFSVFHSISAFCNAGFDLFGGYSGHYTSIIAFNRSVPVIMTISFLIILGGIGFPVLANIIFFAMRKQRLSLHSKIVLCMTAILIVVGTVLFMILEKDNINSIGNMSFSDGLLNAFMQSVTTRTAGYSSLNLENLHEATLFLMILLMFIGASPASTGGGIKTVTFAVLVLSIKAVIKDKLEITIFKRRLSKGVIPKALAIFITASFALVTGTFILTTIEPRFDLLESCFEVASALATVGLSIGGTPNLTLAGRILVMMFMFAGRVGMITLFMSILSKELDKESKIRYPEEKVMIG